MMTTFFKGALVATVLITSIPVHADAFTGRRGARVNQVNANVFEVVPRNSGNGSDFWCAASEYARMERGAGWRDRIYISRGRGVSETTGRRSSVQFTLDPVAVGVTPIDPPLSINQLKVGESMSVQQADGYCERMPVRF